MGQCSSQCNSILGRRSSDQEQELRFKDNIPDPSLNTSTTVSKKHQKKKDSLRSQYEEKDPIDNLGQKTNPIYQKDYVPKKILKKGGEKKELKFKNREDSNDHFKKDQNINGEDCKIKQEEEQSNIKNKEVHQQEEEESHHEHSHKNQNTCSSIKKDPGNQSANKQQPSEESSSSEEQLIKITQQLNQESPLIEFRATLSFFYATTGGTACELAFEVANLCEQQGFSVKVIHLEEFEPPFLASCNVAIFILSSSGHEGFPTEDSHQFYLWLNDNSINERKAIGNINFSVFGLYNSEAAKRTIYINNSISQIPSSNLDNLEAELGDKLMNSPGAMKKSNQIKSMGQRVNHILEQSGARSICRMQFADSFNKETFNNTFKNYKDGLIKSLMQEFPVKKIPQASAQNSSLNFDVNIIPSGSSKEQIQKSVSGASYNESLKEYLSCKEQKVVRMELMKSEKCRDGLIIKSFQRKDNKSIEVVQQGTQISQSLLEKDLESQEFMEIELECSDSLLQQQQNNLEIGKVVEVFASNDKNSIEQMLSLIEVSKYEIIQVISRNKIKKSSSSKSIDLRQSSLYSQFTPDFITVYEFIRDFMDLRTPVKSFQLYILSQFAQNPKDKITLREMCEYKNKSSLKQEQIDGRLKSLLTLIQSFDFQKMPISILLQVRRVIQPRRYFISFCSMANSQKILLTVKLKSEGMASRFFKEKEKQLNQEKKEVKLRIKSQKNKTSSNKDENDCQSVNHISSSIKLQFNQVCGMKLNETNLTVIIICQDEGIAMFRSYFQELQNCKNSQRHKIYLFYGCRQFTNNEFLASYELRQLHSENIIHQLYVAHSNPVNQKPPSQENLVPLKSSASVAALLLENLSESQTQLLKSVEDSNAKIFISGTQLMGQGVLGVIAKSFQAYEKISQLDAFNQVLNLESEGKIIRMTW